MSTETTNKKIKIDNGTTFGKTYTDKAIDAKETALNAVIPTDVGIKDNKLGLLHDTKWLTNQGAINLDGFEYDSATNTLKAGGGLNIVKLSLDASTMIVTGVSLKNFLDIAEKPILFSIETNVNNKQFQAVNIIASYSDVEVIRDNAYINLGYFSTNFVTGAFGNYRYRLLLSDDNSTLEIIEENSNIKAFDFEANMDTLELAGITMDIFNEILMSKSLVSIYVNVNNTKMYVVNVIVDYSSFNEVGIDLGVHASNPFTKKYGQFRYQIVPYESNKFKLLITEEIMPKSISLFGNHSILVPSGSADDNIDLYTHNIVMSDTNENPQKQLFITIPSSSNLVVDSFTDLNTLLGTTKRTMHCGGFVAPTTSGCPCIQALDWQGTYASSKYITNNASTGSLGDFTVIKDDVTTL